MTAAAPPRASRTRSRRPALVAIAAGLLLLALVAVRVLVGTPMVPLDLAAAGDRRRGHPRHTPSS